MMTVRSVIGNLIYNDFYDTIDKNMSDSNVGGKRARNIRDNLFTFNGTSVSAQLKLRFTLPITPTNQKRAPARGLTNHKR